MVCSPAGAPEFGRAIINAGTIQQASSIVEKEIRTSLSEKLGHAVGVVVAEFNMVKARKQRAKRQRRR